MKRTPDGIERDLAALFKRGHALRDESAELNRTAKELAKEAARLKRILAKQQRPAPRGPAVPGLQTKSGERNQRAITCRTHPSGRR